jgi:phage RecT family recombinase|tara:strand:- start:2327 stop:3184 length:858 start_codon:yes stop_codon:yes gene_type:complete
MSNALHPAHQFRNVVESKASDFLQAMVGTENGLQAAGRVALAFRQAAQTNDRLYGCDPASVAQAVALSAMTGLMPGGPLPDVYLLPRGKSLQWQVSHRGFSKLAAKNGVRLRTKAVFDTDEFHVIEGTEPNLRHVPDLNAEQSWTTLKAVYVVAFYQDGTKDFVVIRKADIEKRRANSDAYKRNKNQSPWGQWPIEMALKTGLRYAFARGIVPMNDDMQNAYDHDGKQDTPTEELKFIDVNSQHDESDTMGILSEQIDGLMDDSKDKEVVQSAKEDDNQKSLLDD